MKDVIDELQEPKRQVSPFIRYGIPALLIPSVCASLIAVGYLLTRVYRPNNVAESPTSPGITQLVESTFSPTPNLEAILGTPTIFLTPIDTLVATPSLTDLVQSPTPQPYTPTRNPGSTPAPTRSLTPFPAYTLTPIPPTKTSAPPTSTLIVIPTSTLRIIPTSTPVPPTSTKIPNTPTPNMPTSTRTLIPPTNTPSTVFDVYNVWIEASETSYTGPCPHTFEFWEHFTWSGTGYATVQDNDSPPWDKYVSSFSGISTSNTQVIWTRNDLTTGSHTLTYTYKILSPRSISASQDFQLNCTGP
jgi:hypothetical protein